MATTQKIRKYPKAGTIGSIVLGILQKNSSPNLDELTKTILNKFPDSKFNKAHLAWYKHQVKNGAYNLNDAPKTNKKKKTTKTKKTYKTMTK